MKRIAAATLLLALLFTVNVFAVGEARVTGIVTDTEGNPVPNVDITVTATEKMTFEKNFTTNDKGKFAIFLLDGTIRYEFAFSKEGYATYKNVWKLELIPTKNEKEVVLQPEQAAQPAGVVASEAPASNPAYGVYNEAVTLANEGHDAEAVAKLEEAIEIDPELSAAWTALTRLYARTQQWEKTVEAGDKALELVGEDQVIAALMADAYTMLGDEEKAKEYRKIAPANPAVLFNEAVPHLNANRDDKAEELLKQAVDVDDTFAKAHYELGALYARQGNSEDAKKHLMRYLELEPDGENAAFAREMVKYLD